MIERCQRLDPGSIPGRRTICCELSFLAALFDYYKLIFNSCHVVVLLRIYRVDLKKQLGVGE
jgi:hypothetical protein